MRRDVDLAVRNVRPTQTGLVARKIGAVKLGLHARRRYLEAVGIPRIAKDLKNHALIGYDQDTPFVRSRQARGMHLSRNIFALRTDNDLAHLAAIRAGYGIGVCQVAYRTARSQSRADTPKQFAFDLDIWLVKHENLRANPRMRTVFDHLGEALSEHAGRLRRARTAV